jgi:hypothetical protein
LTEDLERRLRRRMQLWQIILRYGAAVIVVVFYVTASLHFSYTPDETYVYLQYGRNIARGEGISFNAGSTSYGVTGPLWAILIAGGVKLSLDPYIVAKTLDIVLASVAVMSVLAFAFIVIRDRLYALIAAWIFSFDAWFLRSAGSGTETSLAVLLAMLALWYAYKKEHITSSLVAGLLTLVRPEGVFLFLAAQVDAALNSRNRISAVRIVVGSVVVYAMVVGTWLGFAYFHFGTIFPNQLQSSPFSGFAVAAMLTNAFANMKIVGATQLVPVLFLIGGFVVTVRKFGWHIIREEGFPLIWALAVPLCYVVFNVDVASRQLLLVLPVFVVYGLWGIKRLEIASLVSPQRGLFILLLVAGVSLAQNQIVYRGWVLPHMNTLELGVNECLKPMAFWLRANTPAGTTVLTPQAGVIGYVSERKVFDASGVIAPEVRRAFGDDTYDTGMKERKYELVIHPDYVIDQSPIPDQLASEALKPIMTRIFPGLGITRPELMYYTLYKVTR